MCLFTHCAAGAVAGGATGNVWAAIVAGLASHAVLDVLPHYDHPDWRLELAGGTLTLLLVALLPFGSAAALVGGLAGMAPDLENLLQKLGRISRDRFVFPTHTGLLPHGRRLGPRSLGWQVAIWVGCLALLPLVAPSAAVAAADDAARLGEPVVRVLSAGAERTVVRIDVPVEEQPADWNRVDPRRVVHALPPAVSEPAEGAGGLMEVLPPRLNLLLAVPTRLQPTVTVTDLSWWRAPSVAVAPVEMAQAGMPGVSREVPLSGLSVDLGTGDGILSGLTVTVTHPVGAGYREALRAADLVDPATDKSAAAHAARVLNPTLRDALAGGGRELLRAAAATKAPPAFDPFAATSDWVRLELSETGLYRLTGQQLSSFGLPVSSVEPGDLRLYRGGGLQLAADPEVADDQQPTAVTLNEVAIEVLDGGDGEWNLDDEIRFYGVGTSTWRDRLDPVAERLDHYDHPYAPTAVYWLTWAPAAALPGTPARVQTGATPPLGGERVDTARLRIHAERQFLDTPGVFLDNWAWASSVFNSRAEDFEMRPPLAGSAARFVVDVRGHYDTYSSYQFTASAWLNADDAQRGELSFIRTAQDDSVRLRVTGETTDLVEGTNRLTLRNDSPEPRRPLVLDSFDVLYWTALELDPEAGQLDFAHWRDQAGVPGTVDFHLAVPAGQTPVVWDVTDPARARVIDGTPGDGELVWGVTRTADTDRHYQASMPADLLSVATGSRTSPRSLFARGTAFDYVVVTPAAFLAAAEDLAAYRSSRLPGVANPAATAVRLADIYANFSGGQKDPRAVRNYLRWLYRDGAARLRYVCFLGNASRDYRNHKDRTPQVDLYDMAPTELRTAFPTYPIPLQRPMAFASDHGMVSFDTAPVSLRDYPDYDPPEVACGRLPAVDAAEAREMVDRAIAYADEPETGPWRNSVVFTSDDVIRPSTYPNPTYGELVHTAEAEEIVEDLLPPGLDVTKLYGVDYPFPPSSVVKPALRADINAALSDGSTIFYYVGHGAEDNLADEQIFQSRDIPNLSNGMRRPLFVAFSCDVGVFDSPTRRSMAEQFIQYRSGGAIGAICAAQVSWSTDNNQVAEAFFANLYPARTTPGDRTVSEALRLALGEMGDVTARANSQRYNLMGEPALVLPHPVDDLQFAADSLDTLRAGSRHAARLATGAKLALVGAGDAYSLRVEDSARDIEFPVTTSGLTSTFRKPGAPVFAGTGTVGAGDLVVPFKVPAQIGYGDHGRVRLLVSSPDGEHSAVQSVPAVRGSTGAANDVRGPAVTLQFADGDTRVQPGQEMQATLADTSGIAILGTGPGNSLLLEFDNTGFMTDVTSSFAYDPDSYTTGSLTVALPQDLDAGPHTAALFASDALGNVGSDTLSFHIGSDLAGGFGGVSLFPNPTTGRCRLLFGVADPMRVRWDVYSLSGRRLYSAEAEYAESGNKILEWDGRDERGDEIANGTYLYVLRGSVEDDDTREFTKTGKLVIMR